MSQPNIYKKISLKVVMNKQKSSVLFAEANSDFVDVLLSFLSLPLGKIVRDLKNHYGGAALFLGSLTTLYDSLVNVDTSHFSDAVRGAKQLFLNPKNSFQVESFIIKSASFIISDDLQIVPAVSNFRKTLLNLSVTDINGGEMTTISIDADDIMDLLKLCLTSPNPITDLVHNKTQKSLTGSQPEPRRVFHHIPYREVNSGAMVLKIFMQQSTNKVLLAEAPDEFVEFLFSFLAVPLCEVGNLLGLLTLFGNIDNLWLRVRFGMDEYFRSPDAKARLTNQNIPSLTKPFLSTEGIKEEGGGVKGRTMYIISDDLVVTPFSVTSCVSILIGLGVSLYDVTEHDFQIGLEEALDILRVSLSSTTVFTDALVKPWLSKPSKPSKRPRSKR